MRWLFPKATSNSGIKDLTKALNINPLLVQLLWDRGIDTFEKAKDFFRPQLQHLHDPFLMKDMDLAVTRLGQAIRQNERILVYGDYDVDGTTSVALMMHYLRTQTDQVVAYIPDRYQEGYGISFQGIDFADDNGITLIIALDCGIKAVDKVAYASKKGIDFIICDHHTPPKKLPPAVAVLDPKRIDCTYPEAVLCGCGVGFKLIQAYHQSIGAPFDELIPFLDLVATAIAADIVPITGENRVLAYYGLKQINTHPRPGLEVLIGEELMGRIKISHLVFGFAPRINAAGRMSHALKAVDLLLAKDTIEAQQKADEIEALNAERRWVEKEVTDEAFQLIKKNKEEEAPATIVFQPHWHKGVIGIVASRLMETYYRPTLVFTQSGDKLTASARSVDQINIHDALEACSDLLVNFGGHHHAAGLTLLVEHYEAFKKRFYDVISVESSKKQPEKTLEVNGTLSLNQITTNFCNIIHQMEPFGPENRAPVFVCKELINKNHQPIIGQDRSHLKLRVNDGSTENSIDAIAFGMAHQIEKVSHLNRFSIAFSIEENYWNGQTTTQLAVKDIK